MRHDIFAPGIQEYVFSKTPGESRVCPPWAIPQLCVEDDTHVRSLPSGVSGYLNVPVNVCSR